MYRNLRPAPLNMALVRGPRPAPKGYRNFRPAPLNMALVPGLHLSTSKGKCPPKPDEDANVCSSKHCDPKVCDDPMDSCSTTADGESLESFSETDDSRSEMMEASQDDLCEADSEPSSPFSRMLEAKRRGTMPQATEPSSPFSNMLLLRARRQGALACGF